MDSIVDPDPDGKSEPPECATCGKRQWPVIHSCPGVRQPRSDGSTDARVRLYVAGPMSGCRGFNYPAFFDAERRLMAARYAVLNSARNPKQSSWDGYMRTAIAQVIQADGIAVLPDWQMSAGAALEVHIAHALCVPVHSVEHWVSLDESWAA